MVEVASDLLSQPVGITASRQIHAAITIASKRGGHKCSRTEIQKSAYAEEKAGDETEIDQSFA